MSNKSYFDLFKATKNTERRNNYKQRRSLQNFVAVLCFLNLLLDSGAMARHWIPRRNDVMHHVPSGSQSRIRPPTQNIRFHVTYDKSLEHLSSNKNNLIVKKLIPEALNYFHKMLKVRRTISKIKLQHMCHEHSYFLKDNEGKHKGSVLYCKKKCVTTYCGPVVIPIRHLDQCRICNEQGSVCKNTTIGVFNRGIKNKDFVFYVSALQTQHCQQTKAVAYASYCQQEHSLDRPIAGFVNICPDELEVEPRHYPNLLATIKHEIFHALGFSAGLYAFYRDKFGRPLTPRAKFGLPQYNNIKHLYKWSSRVVRVVERKNWETVNGLMTHKIQIVVTPRVRREVRKHFHCSTLQGAELENQGPDGTRWTHWEKRVFENEAMTGTYTQNPVFSRITLALMEDTGWYKVDYKMAEELDWGKQLGCVFATSSCRTWMKRKLRQNKSPSPYCFQIKQSPFHTRCTHSKDAVALCNLKKYSKSLPKEYQYFNHLATNQSGSSVQLVKNTNRYGGSVNLADYCPFYQKFSLQKSLQDTRETSCHISDNGPEKDENYALESYGEHSKCIEQASQWTARTGLLTRTMLDWGSGCYKTSCTKNGIDIIVDDKRYFCPTEGHVVYITGKLDKWLINGTLKCPSYKDFCSEGCPKNPS